MPNRFLKLRSSFYIEKKHRRAVFGLIMLSAMAMQPRAFAAEAVKIGIVLPLTGGLADAGKDFRQGIIWAQDRINDSGGIKSLNGAKLDVVFADSKGDAKEGISAIRELLSRHNVSLVGGAYQSGVTLATARIAEGAKVPYLVVSALSDNITESGLKYTFRAHAPVKDWVRTQFDFIDWLNKQHTRQLGKKIENIAILYNNSDYGVDIAKKQLDRANQLGYKVIENLSYENNTVSVSSIIKRLCSSKAQVVLQSSFLPDALLIAKTQKQLDCKMPITIGGGAGHSESQFASSGYDVDNIFVTANWNGDITKDFNKTLVEGYESRWGEAPNSLAAGGVSYTYVVKEILEQAGSADKTQIYNTMRSFQTDKSPPAISGANQIKFNEYGQNIHPEIVITQIQKEIYKTVYPAELAPVEPVLPLLED